MRCADYIACRLFGHTACRRHRSKGQVLRGHRHRVNVWRLLLRHGWQANMRVFLRRLGRLANNCNGRAMQRCAAKGSSLRRQTDGSTVVRIRRRPPCRVRRAGAAAGPRTRSSSSSWRAYNRRGRSRRQRGEYGVSRSLLLRWRGLFRPEPKDALVQQMGFVPAMVVLEAKTMPSPAGSTGGGANKIAHDDIPAPLRRSR
jgi:hypothetical protein